MGEDIRYTDLRKVGLLGCGGFGAVSKAERLSDGVVVAVKSVLQPNERVLQEAERHRRSA